MKKGCAVVMLLLLCPAFLYAGDTLSVMQRNLRNNSFGETFFDLLYRNPAEKYYQHALTLPKQMRSWNIRLKINRYFCKKETV